VTKLSQRSDQNRGPIFTTTNFSSGVAMAGVAVAKVASSSAQAVQPARSWVATNYEITVEFLIELWATIKNNWSTFWSRPSADDAVATTSSAVISADLRAELKAEILAELKSDLMKAPVRETPASQGIVVVPLSSELVANNFSDPVKVEIDAAGQSGIITPTFRDKQGSSYLFLLTPIKR
jgi:hypothetical protein